MVRDIALVDGSHDNDGARFYESVGPVKDLRIGDETRSSTLSLTGTSFYPHSL